MRLVFEAVLRQAVRRDADHGAISEAVQLTRQVRSVPKCNLGTRGRRAEAFASQMTQTDSCFEPFCLFSWFPSCTWERKGCTWERAWSLKLCFGRPCAVAQIMERSQRQSNCQDRCVPFPSATHHGGQALGTRDSKDLGTRDSKDLGTRERRGAQAPPTFLVPKLHLGTGMLCLRGCASKRAAWCRSRVMAEAVQLPGQARSQVQLGNEENLGTRRCLNGDVAAQRPLPRFRDRF
jgi:hypothetical protein